MTPDAAARIAEEYIQDILNCPEIGDVFRALDDQSLARIRESYIERILLLSEKKNENHS